MFPHSAEKRLFFKVDEKEDRGNNTELRISKASINVSLMKDRFVGNYISKLKYLAVGNIKLLKMVIIKVFF